MTLKQQVGQKLLHGEDPLFELIHAWEQTVGGPNFITDYDFTIIYFHGHLLQSEAGLRVYSFTDVL